ncbi:MAG: hypothetical protein WBC85_07955 [Planktotalea sp.]|uniref:hypothetical protein n=1 Tax=Planktotalea sp. TaxID=2029877 RepID=UPI003C74E2AE
MHVFRVCGAIAISIAVAGCQSDQVANATADLPEIIEPEPVGTVSSSGGTPSSTLYPTTPLKTLSYSDPAVVDSAAFKLSSNHGPAVYGAFAYEDGNAEAIVKKFSSEYRYLYHPDYHLSVTKPALPLTGSAKLDGTVGIAYAERTGYDDEGIAQYTIANESGALTLLANFDDKTLTGTSDLIAVNGRYDDRALEGSVVYDGINGELDGRFSGIRLRAQRRSDGDVTIYRFFEALGTFHGSDEDRGKTFAGAFRATSN